MATDLGEFFLNVLKEIMNAFCKAKERKDNLVALGTFLELYGSAARLQGYANALRGRAKARSSEATGMLLQDFFEEVHHFGKILRKANLSAIEVFHPRLASELARITDSDASIASAFDRRSGRLARFKLKSGKLKDIV